uniref:Uncharacterized protein n=1 Tax=Anopheles maculatus TaxID=74869 RepID=A0A182T856_9DIPT
MYNRTAPQIPETISVTTSELLSRRATLATENVLDSETSKHIPSELDKDTKEVEKISISQTTAVPETVETPYSDLLSHSINESRDSSNGDISEHLVTAQEQEQVHENAVEQE